MADRGRVWAIVGGIALGLVLLTGGLAYLVFLGERARHETNAVVETETSLMVRFQDARTGALRETTALSGYYILQQPQLVDLFHQARADVEEALAASLEEAARGDPEDVEAVEEMEALHGEIAAVYEQAIVLIDAGDSASLIDLVNEGNFDERATEFLAKLDAAIDDSRAELVAAQRDNEASQTFWDRLILALAGGWALLVVAAGYAVYAWLVRPLEREQAERLRRELQLEQERARLDSLTGVLKHAVLMDDLRAMIESAAGARRLAVAMVDVDGMKAANDTYGHQSGDTVLMTVAKALARDAVIVGRYGGDEFTVILPDADRVRAEAYRDAVVQDLAATKLTEPVSGATVPVVVSIGLAVYPDEAETADELVRLADNAMYAWRRDRGADGLAPVRTLGDQRAARMVGQIVPLLTAPADLEHKLRLVAHQLSVGAGYEAVSFALYNPRPGETVVATTFAQVPDKLVEDWNRDQMMYGGEHPIPALLEQVRKPIILNELGRAEGLSAVQREILRQAGIRSGLVAPMQWRGRLVGTLAIGSKREQAFGPADAQFAMAVATQVSAIAQLEILVEQLAASSNRLERAHVETVMMLAAAAEAHDDATGRHLRNLRSLTEALASELGYGQEDAAALGLAAVLHDIGKLRVPDALLTYTGTLSKPERKLMEEHTIWGGELLAGRQGFELAETIARHHHERWDGTGYPQGLAGEAIPEAARIVSVADAFDAMVTDRPYRAGCSTAEAVAELRAWSGRQFSPVAVEAFVRLYRRGTVVELLQDQPERAAA